MTQPHTSACNSATGHPSIVLQALTLPCHSCLMWSRLDFLWHARTPGQISLLTGKKSHTDKLNISSAITGRHRGFSLQKHIYPHTNTCVYRHTHMCVQYLAFMVHLKVALLREKQAFPLSESCNSASQFSLRTPSEPLETCDLSAAQHPIHQMLQQCNM